MAERALLITYTTTNLFESSAQTLVNAVNTVGVMGKGIALEFKNRYPDMFKEYRAVCAQGEFGVGKLLIYRAPKHLIVNFPTKKHWRQPSRLEYIDAGLAAFIEQYYQHDIISVSFPQLGCGSGDLDWVTQVRPLMEQYLQPLLLEVYIHLYAKP